jgi:hypothetical protein
MPPRQVTRNRLGDAGRDHVVVPRHNLLPDNHHRPANRPRKPSSQFSGPHVIVWSHRDHIQPLIPRFDHGVPRRQSGPRERKTVHVKIGREHVVAADFARHAWLRNVGDRAGRERGEEQTGQHPATSTHGRKISPKASRSSSASASGCGSGTAKMTKMTVQVIRRCTSTCRIAVVRPAPDTRQKKQKSM